jgi:Domain of unknown function (DUF4157)/LysM domain
LYLGGIYCIYCMSFALVHQNKNKEADSKTSRPAKPSHHINNLAMDSYDSIIHLQRMIDNQALQKPLYSGAGFDFSKIGILQPKLKIGQTGDENEQEADKVVGHITRMPTSDSIAQMISKKEESIDRKCNACEMKEDKEEDEKQLRISPKPSTTCTLEGNEEITNEVNNVLSSGGSSLDASTRELMEPRFGYDFSNVKIYTGESAARSVRSVDALAYTVGNDIVFDEGMYMPGTMEGRRLLAHELAHIIQQGPTADRRNGKLTVELSSSPFEQEAEQAAEYAATGRKATLSRILPNASVARMQRAEHGTYVSTKGPSLYLNAGEQFYRTWGHPNVKRVSTMADVLADLDHASGDIDKFRIVSHGTSVGLELGLLPQVAPALFGKVAASFTTEKRFREHFIDPIEGGVSLVSENLFERIYNEMQKDKTAAALLATLDAGKDVPAPESPLGILLRAMVDARYLEDVKLDTGGRATIANRAQLEMFNNLRMTTYGGLVEDAVPKDKRKDVRAAINMLRRNLPIVISSSNLSFVPLTSQEAKKLADPFVEVIGGKTQLREELSESIREGAGGPYLKRLRSVKQKISDKTHIEIRGCNIGKDPDLLDSFRSYFGQPNMLPSISAPDLYQYFFQLNIQTYSHHPNDEAQLETAFTDPTTGLARSFEDLARMKAGEMTRVVEESKLSELAAKYGFNAAKVRKLNPEIADPDKLSPGDVVWLTQRTQVSIGVNKTLKDFCREYLENEYAWPKVLEANPWLKSPSDLKPGDKLQLPKDVLTAPVAAPSPTVGQFTSEIHKGKAVAGLIHSAENRPILHVDDPLRAKAVGEWLAAQKFDPTGRTAVELSKRFLGSPLQFEAARRGTYFQFLSRSYPVIEDPIFPEDPRYDKHIIRRP